MERLLYILAICSLVLFSIYPATSEAEKLAADSGGAALGQVALAVGPMIVSGVGHMVAGKGNEDLGYSIAATGEAAGTALSSYMAYKAFAEQNYVQGAMYTLAAGGMLSSLVGTLDNWTRHNPGDGGAVVGKDDDDLGGRGNDPRSNPDGNPTDTGSPDLDSRNVASENNDFESTSPDLSGPFAGNPDVAVDLFNPDPDSGFGLASLGTENGANAGGMGDSFGGGDGSSGGYSSLFNNKTGADLLAEALQRQLSMMSAEDLARLQAGDADLVADLMRSLGIDGDPNSIDFDMFNNLLAGMFGKDSGFERRVNGVLEKELLKKNDSIWGAIKQTTFAGAYQFHPSFRIALQKEDTKVAMEKGEEKERSSTKTDVSSLMPRKIVTEKKTGGGVNK